MNFKIDKNDLLNNFKNFKKISNIFVIKCYKLLFSKDGLKKNIASYLLIIFIAIVIACIIFFVVKGYDIYKNKITDAVSQREIYNKGDKINIIKFDEPKKDVQKNEKSNAIHKSKLSPEVDKIDVSNITKNEKKSKKSKKIKSAPQNISIQNSTERKINENELLDEELIFVDNDYEINYLKYNHALKFDKRSFGKYYISLIRTKHIIIFTFYTNTDYNSRIVKLCLFLTSFSLYYTLNALFFNDSTMHRIYQDKGVFYFSYQLPQIIYSTIISSIISVIINMLSLSEKKVVEIKKIKNLETAINRSKSLLKCLKIKFSIFFILVMILLLLFWYYLSCFSAVFKNTQIFLIKDTIISFAISLIYPFLTLLIPCALRISALKDENKNKECLYKSSLILQLIL